MFFNSLDFLLFFVCFFVLYRMLDHQRQNVLLIIASCLFYSFWSWKFLFLMFVSITVDFICARQIAKSNDRRARKSLLFLSIGVNLLILGFFKYFDFFISNFLDLLKMAGAVDPALNWSVSVILPLGISFYTFEAISYVVDVYRGESKPAERYQDYLLFVIFFPHLIAGPIMRTRDFLPQVVRPRPVTWDNFMIGAGYVALGMWKKVIISDNIAWWNNELFGNFTMGTPVPLFWIGSVIFGIQIYCDFSGYSDIAIGLARMCGINLPDNFNNPYFSKNISEFWSRWHITLSRWLKDYLYIPLGGNRKGSVRTYVNLMITMLLGGLWHGASWNFVIWGGIQGAGLAAHKFYSRSALKQLLIRVPFYNMLMWVFTLAFICLSWLVFRIRSAEGLIAAGRRIFDLVHFGSLADLRGSQIKSVVPFVVMFLVHEAVMSRVSKEALMKKILTCSTGLLCGISFVYGLFFACFLPGQKTPFIYFQF